MSVFEVNIRRQIRCRARRWPALALAVGLAWACLTCAAQAQTQIIINQLDDISLGTWSGSGNMTGNSKHCVGTSPNNRNYLITATGSGAAAAFTITNGTTPLAYTVSYKERGSAAWTDLTSGVASGPYQGWRLDRCQAGRERQRVRVRFFAANLIAATAGTYNGTLYLLVAPQ
jgi:hypothetical protein